MVQVGSSLLRKLINFILELFNKKEGNSTMKSQKTNPVTISTYKAVKKIRNDWGNLNPITRRIENKKKDYEYPDSYYDYEEDIDLDEWSDW